MAENRFIIKNGVVVESSENNSMVFDIQGISRRIISVTDNTSGEIVNISNTAGGTAISIDANGKVSFPSNILVTGATFMGSVGIGTVGTSNILTLRGTTSNAGLIFLDPIDGSTHFNIYPGPSTTDRQMNINFPGATNSTDNLFILRFNSDNNKLFFGDNGTTATISAMHNMAFSSTGIAGTPGMILLSNGNLGLGTITPDARIHIHLNSGATAENQNSKSLSITSVTSDNSFANYTHYGAYIAPEFNGNYNCSTGYGLYLNPTISGHDGFGTMYSFYNASVYNSYFNGSVGIGIVPTQQLDIYKASGGTYWNEGIRVRRGAASTQYGIINYYGGALRIAAIVEGGSSSGEIYFERHNAGSGTPSTSMMINTVGNLGVGTINQVYRTEIKPATDTYSLALIQSDSTQAGWGFQADTSGNLQIARYNTSMSNKITISSTGAANFVSTVAATAFTENGTTLSAKYLGITATAANASKLGGELPSYYALASALSAYLPLTGGEVSGLVTFNGSALFSNTFSLYVRRNADANPNIVMQNLDSGGSVRTLGYITMPADDNFGFYRADGTTYRTVLHSGNYTSYAATASHNHNGTYALASHNHDDRYYTETEIANFFSGSVAISGYNKSSWDTAYGWGNHAVAGYANASSLSSHTGNTSNPHSVTAAQVGALGVNANAVSASLLSTTQVTDESLAIPALEQFKVYRTLASTATGADGYINSWTWGGGSYVTQLYVEVDPTYNMSIRHRDNAGVWNGWKKIWTEANLLNIGTTASSARTALGLGTMATETASNYSQTSHNHSGVYHPLMSTIFSLQGSYVGVRTANRTASQYYEFWDSGVGWAKIHSGGFVNANSSDSYILLGGGGTKAISDFSPTSHNHNGTYAPINGSTYYIQNQYISAQSANMWISGVVRPSELQLDRADNDTVYIGSSVWLGDTYVGLRVGTDKSFNIDTYNSGSNLNVLKILQSGAATFSSSITAVSGLFDAGLNATSNEVRVSGGWASGNIVTLWVGNNHSTYKNYSPYFKATVVGGIDNYSLKIGLNNSDALTFSTTLAATFASSVSATSFISGGNAVLHAGNYSSYALPLSGGTLTSSNALVLALNSTSASETYIALRRNGTTQGNIGYYDPFGTYMQGGSKILYVNNTASYFYNGSTSYELIHSGNIGSQSVNYAASAATISNTGTVTLGSATEANSITITQPTYFTDKPVKLLNFNWYSDTWSLGNIRSGGTPSMGLGVYLNSIEKYRFTDSALFVGLHTVIHAGNFSSYALPLYGGRLTGNMFFTTISTDNYNTAVLQGNWNGAGYWGLGSDGIHTIKIDQINGLGSTQAFAGATDIVLKLGTKTVIDSGNIGSQSVNYATSATSANNAEKLKSYYPTGNVDVNTYLASGGALWHYGQGVTFTNTPSWFTYGSIYQFNSTTSDSLSLQIATSTLHNTTTPSYKIGWRMSNNLGYQNDWKEIYHTGNLTNTLSNGYLPYWNGSSLSDTYLSINSSGVFFNSISASAHRYFILNKTSGYDGGILWRLSGVEKFQQVITNSGDMDFYNYTYGGVAVRFTAGGNVGIGTTSPQFRVEMDGGQNTFAASFSTSLGTNQFTGIHFGYRENNTYYRKSALVFERIDDAARGTIHILNNGNYDNSSATLADAKLSITYGGNIGIGTSTPEFSDWSTSSKGLVINAASNGYGILKLIGTSTAKLILTAGSGANYLWCYGANPFAIGVNGTERLNIISNGNIGIGYTTGTEITNNKLAVNGSGYFNGVLTTDTYLNSTGTGDTRLLYQRTGISKLWQIGVDGSSTYFTNITDGRIPFMIYNNGRVSLGENYNNSGFNLQVNGISYFTGDARIGTNGRLGWEYGDGYMYNWITNSYANDGGILYRSGSWTSGDASVIVSHNFQTWLSGAWSTAFKIYQDQTAYFSKSVYVVNGILSLSRGSGEAYSSKISTEYTYPYIDTFIDSIAGASYEGRISFRTSSGGGALSSKMIIANNGNVSIGSADTSFARLFVSGAGGYAIGALSSQQYIFTIRNTSNTFNASYGWWLGHKNDGSFMIHHDGQGDRFTIGTNGAASFAVSITAPTITATTSMTSPAYYHYSDITLKNVISPLESSLDKLRNMSTFYYTLKDDSSQRIQLGMSAQEFDTYFPTLVGRDSNNKLQLEYPRISVIAIKAIQELDATQQEQTKTIQSLMSIQEDQEREITLLKGKLEQLEEMLRIINLQK